MAVFSIIQKSQLEGAHRLDAEYYQPEYLDCKKKIENFGYKNLGDLLEILTDYHANGSYEVLKRNVQISNEKNFTLMVRSVDLERGDFNTDVRYVTEKAFNFLKKTKISGNEIIIDKIGNTGATYLMPKLNRPVTLGMNLFMLRLKKEIDPEFLYVFLNSRLGKLAISQKITGMNPTSIDKASVRSIKIPIVPKDFSDNISQLVKRVFVLEEESKKVYSQAENLLLEELELKKFKSENELWSVVNLSETKKANRIDADYFQPKYGEILEKIKNHNAIKIGDLADLVGHATQSPYNEAGDIAVLAQTHMKHNMMIDTTTFSNYTKEDLIKKNDKKFILKKGDMLISSAGEPGLTNVWTGDYDGKVIPGSFVTLARIKKEIEPLYAGLFLNTPAGKLQFERYCTGSIQQYVYPVKIKDILIPILPKPIQQKIADLVQQSHEARKEAKQLLEEAKNKVEEMIENGTR